MTVPTALKGVRVLDFSQMMAGPLCATLLADFGADVIKIEPPEGDAMRNTGETRIGGETEFFLSVNRNKRSIVLDLKTPQGLEAALRLIDTADVLIENFRPGTADRLGIGYEAVRARNPRLVYCSLSGFGKHSIHRDRPALDPVIQAMSGIMQLTGTRETGPLRSGFAISDFSTPLFAAYGVAIALLARGQTGQGQRLDLSMLHATICAMVPREGYYFATGRTPQRQGNEHYQIVPYNAYETADRRGIFLIAHNDKYWRALVRALAEPALADPRFAASKSRIAHREELNERIALAMRRHSADEWVRRLAAEGALFSLVRSFEEVFTDPEVAREMVVSLPHPTAGEVRVLANPLQLSATPATMQRAPPLLGQHTAELLAEIDLAPEPKRA
ncbi:MAG: CoA transferase [Burkholderiaceae bacterium]|nr:CoA transferase [Burkholderiaceae bacterium]